MRLREVKEGMRVKIYRSMVKSGEKFVGVFGVVVGISSYAKIFPVIVDIEGYIYNRLFGGVSSLLCSHKELKEVK